MTYSEAEKSFIDNISTLYDPLEAKSLAWLSMNHVSKLERAKYLSIKNEEMPAEHMQALYNIQNELASGRPLQYIIGETEFYGLIFLVNPDVLIPRPETEELVDWALITLRGIEKDPVDLKILDIGTGSGCIPVAIKKFFPDPEVYALDISSGALATARKNALLNETEIHFIQVDILYPVNDILPGLKFDLIISNPPYVRDSEKQQMLKNVIDHEPHTALFVPDSDPLLFYKSIADFAFNNLQDDGYLLLEINENLGTETCKMLVEKGFKNIELRQDIRGKDRMIKASLK
ncbi:peptide chain release factor N(5)-glutamine methyltransferase [Daejeonella sp. H1SJ63]|jgi:release factor glutamine methyltransferase|uniref:peptide chain release factor N(5)-glutamine methyltransferase n=1 Tax=Daejeonella sp. H1SJ63 TaxID=3034145 RepID=UPI0023EBE4A0|nr:peptide chain release factor N(5)-glutamine methyltransferase [Daejeonella sp. H1SJ63]